jgi:predicted dehydrogenase
MFSAFIMGAGQIAGGYDAPSDPGILTHAHAYKSHGQFDILGFYDVDKVKADAMAKKWGVKAFEAPQHADVISICTPDDRHLASLKAALELKPRIVFLEKPLSNDQGEAREILELSKKVPVQVNYSRRFVKAFQDLKERDLGRFRSGCGSYGKGFLHNGSHMLALLNLLVGKIRKIDVLESFVDFYEKDPTKTAVLTFAQDAKFFMQGVDCRNFTVFELDLVFEKARVRILNSAYEMEIYEPQSDPGLSGYKRLVLKSTVKTGLDQAMNNAVANIYQHLTGGAPLVSPVSQAYEVFECLK